MINPKLVPYRTLSTGARMPAIGLGTFGSDQVSHKAVADAVQYAASIGYRHFDCASVYGNEDQIGRVFGSLFQNGLRRDDVWITSKLWNDKHGENDVIPSCEKSLADLRIDYLAIMILQVVMSVPATRMLCPTSTRTTCAPGAGWKNSWIVGWFVTSAR